MSDETISLGDAGIDPNAEPQSGSYELLPKGKYRQELTAIKVVRKESGAVMVDIEGTLTEAPYQNRKIWTSINIVKKDGTVNQIGNGQISALAKACGRDSIPNDEQVLLGIPHIVTLGIDENPGYEPKNKMTGFAPLASTGKQILQQKVKEQGAFDARNSGISESEDLPF